ncbi:DUF4142 domain-containing protein [Flaviflagellibacter deserti]|uniref:DUF4142 domain-containing protein n=1 Tax=Flaviflagellibacter deserti TaxID=2267266 RepID=A0ABV9Z6C7_9HYPH
MRKHILLAAAASLALAPAAAFAQGAAPAPMKKPAEMGQQQGQLKSADAKFVQNAAIGGAFEVQSSELALKKGESAEVKDFARMMVRDHGKANRELMDLAKEMGAETPKALDSKHNQVIQKLGGLSGAAFDRMYIQAQLDAHNEAVALFRNYGESSASNSQLKQFATNTLPILQEHRRHVQGLSGVAQGESDATTGRSSAEPMPKQKQAPQ